MKTWFLHNLGLKIISVIIAAVLWWLVHARIEAARGISLKTDIRFPIQNDR